MKLNNPRIIPTQKYKFCPRNLLLLAQHLPITIFLTSEPCKENTHASRSKSKRYPSQMRFLSQRESDIFTSCGNVSANRTSLREIFTIFVCPISMPINLLNKMRNSTINHSEKLKHALAALLLLSTPLAGIKAATPVHATTPSDTIVIIQSPGHPRPR